MRLNAQSSARLPALVRQPGYDRATQAIGVVHLGIGAFHRAHQAVYTDDAMAAGDRNWAIAGVSLRSRAVREAMAPQDGLYTVSERGAAGEAIRLVGAVREVIAAPDAPDRVLDLIAAPTTHVVTLTVSEKGYVRAAGGGLDFGNADIAHDAKMEGAPRTIYGYLAQGLKRRRAEGLSGLTILSCDNLAENSAQLAALLNAFLEAHDAELGKWAADACAFPCSMVDRIAPAVTPADLDHIAARLGMRDEAAVVTEPFRQWVIEDKFAGPRPKWEAGGAQLVANVSAYETAKLRMLNGAHSALAYLGLARGHAHVHEAMQDAELAPLVRQLMIDAAASLDERGPEPEPYAAQLVERFSNPALPHRLAQIAMDGSQKVPQRWLAVLRANVAAGRSSAAHLRALAAWIDYVKGDGHKVEDPMASELAALWRAHGKERIVSALIGEGGMFAQTWTAPADVITSVTGLLRA